MNITYTIGTDVIVAPFSKDVGPTVSVAGSVDVFSLFFTPRLLSIVVEETNRYAKTCREASNPNDDEPWTTDEEEMRAFIGFTILMGINRLPGLYDYWSLNPAMHYFSIASRISHNRFREIKRYLHFMNNDTLVSRDEEG